MNNVKCRFTNMLLVDSVLNRVLKKYIFKTIYSSMSINFFSLFHARINMYFVVLFN